MKQFFKTILRWFGTLKNIQVLSLIILAPSLTVISLAYMAAAIFFPWEKTQQALQLTLLRDGIMYVHGLLFVTIIALTAGLVRSIKIGAGPMSADIDLADEYDGIQKQEVEEEVEETHDFPRNRRGR